MVDINESEFVKINDCSMKNNFYRRSLLAMSVFPRRMRPFWAEKQR